MGSDRNSKERKMKRSSGSQSEDEGQVKKRYRVSDNHAEGSSKKPKSDKHSKSRSGKEEKHRSKGSKHKRDSKSKFTKLSNDDYFSKNNEFATWLKEEKDKFFSDLSTDSAREMFSEFVEEWNSKELKSKYYKGIETGPRSSHKWKIKS